MRARHALRQGPVVAALVRSAVLAARGPSEAVEPDGKVFEATVGPRSAQLVADYVRHVGGSPSAYRGVVPAHLFSQWGFPLLSKTLGAVPYDIKRVLNGGCRIEINRPLAANRPLQLRSVLERIDDDGRRALLVQRLETTTDGSWEPPAVTARVFAVIPLPKDKDEPKRAKKDKARVPADAEEIGRLRLKKNAGLDFAVLTGDFNPVHWIGPYARMAGFKRPILHGFSTLARAIETLNKAVWCGDPSRLKSIDVKFVRPLVLPARAGVYVVGRGRAFDVFVGDAPGGPCYLTGSVEARLENDG